MTCYQEPKDCQHRRAKLGIPPTCTECEAEMHWVVPMEPDYEAAHRSWHSTMGEPYRKRMKAAVDAALRIGDTDECPVEGEHECKRPCF